MKYHKCASMPIGAIIEFTNEHCVSTVFPSEWIYYRGNSRLIGIYNCPYCGEDLKYLEDKGRG